MGTNRVKELLRCRLSAGFLVPGCPIIGEAIPIGGVDTGILDGLRRAQQELFAHFGKAGATIFLIQEIQYGRHN